jgi:hypothetical protein
MRSKPLFFGTLTGIALVALVLSVVSLRSLSTPESSGESLAFTRGQSGLNGGTTAGLPSDQARIPEGMTLTIGDVVEPSISKPVREMSPMQPEELELIRELNPRQNQTSFLEGNVILEEGGADPLMENGVGGAPISQLGGVNFDGITYEEGGTGFPPDTVGDVGPNHYFQSVNASFRIWNKSGTPLTGVIPNNQIWSGTGGRCDNNNDGDPIVLYDQLADRWFFTQFVATSGQYALCAAVSTTPDPLGSYYRYEYPIGSLPDYPKYGVWPDAYYISTNEDTYAAYALNRTAMLSGQSAGSIKFDGETNLLLPADSDGATPPPAGSPGLFYTYKDNSFPNHGGGVDRIEVFEFRPNFGTPASSTFTKVATIPTASFTYTVCGFFNLSCIPMPGTSYKVDALSEWPMARFVYRNMGGYQTLLGNFAVDVGGDRSGIRWFELRKPSGAWVLHQEGTFAPGNEHRWTGSIAMDKVGNIGLGYSVSSTSVYPSLGFTTRLASDPAGQMRSESILHAGSASQSFNDVQRWGDYSNLSIDPSDDCTFWFTNEYYDTSSQYWKTRIGTFIIDGCTATTPTPTPTSTPVGGKLVLNILLKRTSGPNPTATPTQPGPTVTPTATQPSGGTIANGTFEQGSGVGWSETSSGGYDIVVLNTSNDPTLPTHSGAWLAWLGGADNENASVYQTVTIPGSAPYLSYWIFLASQETLGCSYDIGSVSVNGTEIQSYGLCDDNNTGGYVRQSLNLSAYAGQTVTIAFEIVTDSSVNSNFFLDDVSFATSAAEDANGTDFIPVADAGWRRK